MDKEKYPNNSTSKTKLRFASNMSMKKLFLNQQIIILEVCSHPEVCKVSNANVPMPTSGQQSTEI